MSSLLGHWLQLQLVPMPIMPTSLAIKSFIFVSFNVILSHHDQLIIMPTSPAI